MKHSYPEEHNITKTGFLRAAVLGANDGIISTSSLIVGVASSGVSESEIFTISIAALVAGAMSMAAGEYVSVSSQSDIERADIKREAWELKNEPLSELKELEDIYIKRGLSQKLAKEVAQELTEFNALASHVRDELGIIEEHKAKPLEAALTSALTFTLGAALPILIVFLFHKDHLILAESISTIFILFLMGAFAARTGGANPLRGALRVSFWGGAAMGFTAFIGSLFDASIL